MTYTVKKLGNHSTQAVNAFIDQYKQAREKHKGYSCPQKNTHFELGRILNAIYQHYDENLARRIEPKVIRVIADAVQETPKTIRAQLLAYIES